MIIDTHLHESKYSLDSFVSLEEIVDQAREMGMDGICITDHESNEIKEEAFRLSQRTGFLIITGAEVLTWQGDVTVFGLEHIPQEKLHAPELLDLVVKEGGVAVSAHPFRQNNRGMGQAIRDMKLLGGVEAFNGNTEYHHNMDAYFLAQELGLPCLGGSDAHARHEVGRYATVFPDGIRDEKDLIQAIYAREVHPVAYLEGQYLPYPCPENFEAGEIFSSFHRF
ncbi:PHP domain-containing protein [Dehalobacterium formicoaceticum]|uniref:PHP domain-containing protein n=1 Tax=Dehalobacterium formicoaceticum TaxID=51515 RepID=A0ABT1Y7I7_9FIRM|nr:PHP domain-containing protein [Dehalobacterium formicoaceticum]MCR6546518.1 PHP domain-containing protein [Dehalobacterium formicoaceticum]